MSPSALKGFRDFYPQECAERTFITERWRDVARRYGFLEYDGPPLEPLELYTRKSGPEIVEQLYAFTDKGGRQVALRPEMTPTLARMVGERANSLRKPVRWYSIPQLFRYERQQRGRLREHFQLNMDIIGEPDVTADAELIAAAIAVMDVCGLTAADVRARVSDRQLLQALFMEAGVQDHQLASVFGILDKLDRERSDVMEEKLSAAGIGRSAAERIFAILEMRGGGLPGLRDFCGENENLEPHFTRLERYFGYLDALGVSDWVTFDISVVRGLAYYTGIVFELFDARGELRAICGGGRYDTLLEALTGAALPALGFGMGDVVLGELLRERKLLGGEPGAGGVDVWVAYSDDATVSDAMRIASRLRERGRSVEYALGAQKLARQFKSADSAGAREVLVLSPDMLARDEAVLRRLEDGTERRVALESWISGAAIAR